MSEVAFRAGWVASYPPSFKSITRHSREPLIRLWIGSGLGARSVRVPVGDVRPSTPSIITEGSLGDAQRVPGLRLCVELFDASGVGRSPPIFHQSPGKQTSRGTAIIVCDATTRARALEGGLG